MDTRLTWKNGGFTHFGGWLTSHEAWLMSKGPISARCDLGVYQYLGPAGGPMLRLWALQ